jgi:chemotaxis protein methyltransferase CheR
MKAGDLAFVAELARAKAGLAIAPERAFFVESRLATLARHAGAPSVEALVEKLRGKPDAALVRAAVEALATPETSFFRDRTPFERLRDEILPGLCAARPNGRVRVWSAGCATGQEAYSAAMLCEENPALAGVEILATDLSARALEKAQGGLYTQFEVQRGLPIRLLLRHFDKVGENWRASPRLRQRIRWGRLNLVDDIEALGEFDVILCRHVLSGLDPAARAGVLERLSGALAEEGWLLLGAGDRSGAPDAFEPAHGGAGLHRRSGLSA